MIQSLLAPFALIYRAGLSAKSARERWIRPKRLAWPVVSIGNLSLGGSGKTPLVIALVNLLAAHGWTADVLSRGYRRQPAPGERHDAERVDREASARRFGDEPWMIAQLTGAPVFVGNSRYAAGLLAERELPNDSRRVHLLDDGFQHRRLARSLDIVAIHRDDLTDFLLPRGRLREPLSALSRAGAIVLRDEDWELSQPLEKNLPAGAHLWRVRRRLSLPVPAKRPFVFTAIAKPEDFLRSLAAGGVEIVGRKSFRDHHWYTEEDIEAISAMGKRAHCESFIVTEKDAVKLSLALRARLESVAPLCVAGLLVKFVEEEAVARALLSSLDPAGDSQ